MLFRSIRDTSARTRRKEFDGLLERTLEEQKEKKKPKKPVVDENQFTLPGPTPAAVDQAAEQKASAEGILLNGGLFHLSL